MKTPPQELKANFERIKRVYFPRWSAGEHWRVKCGSARNVHGRCDIKTRTVEIALLCDDTDKADALMIHEICHAVASPGHGKIWKARLESAAIKAEQLGRPALAGILGSEIELYDDDDCFQVNERTVTERIETITAHANPPFNLVRRVIAHEYGLLVSEFNARFPKARKWFNEARRDREERKRLRAELRTRTQ